MITWDIELLSSRFLNEANNAERYLREVKVKVKTNASYERVYDEHLARFYVFNYLHGRTFLSSKDALLKELKEFLDYTQTPSDAYDLERFNENRKLYITQLIKEFSYDAI
ncbi:MAG: hypothetical protein ACXWCG_12000 [Flavitalea sp.]